MSINFNIKDDNMQEIARFSRLSSTETKNQYRVYGLAEEGNPPVLFSAQENVFNAEQEKALTTFLTNNGIASATEDVDTANKKIYIGLRRDLRNNPEFCANLVQTIVWFLEGRLDSPASFKIPNWSGSFKSNIPA